MSDTEQEVEEEGELVVDEEEEKEEEGGDSDLESLPEVDRPTRKAAPDFIRGPDPCKGRRWRKVNGAEVLVPESNLTYMEVVAFAYRELQVEKQIPTAAVKKVDVVRLVKHYYPGAWEGKSEPTCINLMKSAFKKAREKYLKEREQLEQSGRTGVESELFQAMREVVGLDKGAKKPAIKRKAAPGKPSALDKIVLAGFRTTLAKAQRPVEVEGGGEGGAEEEEQEVGEKKEEEKVKNDVPEEVIRAVVEPNPTRKAMFLEAKGVRAESLEKSRIGRAGTTRALGVMAKLAAGDDERYEGKRDLQQERLRMELKTDQRLRDRDEERKEEKERREERDRLEREEKREMERERREAEKERREAEKERREEEKARREENKMFLLQQQQHQREASLVQAALLSKLLGGAGGDPTPKEDIEVTLVDSGGAPSDFPTKIKQSSVENFVRDVSGYAASAGVEGHQGIVVQGTSGEISRISSLSQLPQGNKLHLKVFDQFGKKYLKLASV